MFVRVCLYIFGQEDEHGIETLSQLGEVENEYILHNPIVLAICVPKIVKVS